MKIPAARRAALLAGVGALAAALYVAGAPHLPGSYDAHAARFEEVPEVQLFLYAYPDSEPGYTGRGTFGFIADGVELSIHYDPFTLEPRHIVIECTGGGIKEYLREFVRITGCDTVYPDGYGKYADSFISMPEVQAFLEAYPDARPGYTARYTMGFIAEGEVRTDLSIHHDGPDPRRAVIDCHYSEYFGVAEELRGLVEIIRCGTDYYPEGHIAHTDHFMSLPGVRAFLEEYPDAGSGYTVRGAMGLIAEDGGIRAELGMHHDGFSFDPDIVTDCYRDGALYDIIGGGARCPEGGA